MNEFTLYLISISANFKVALMCATVMIFLAATAAKQITNRQIILSGIGIFISLFLYSLIPTQQDISVIYQFHKQKNEMIERSKLNTIPPNELFLLPQNMK